MQKTVYLEYTKNRLFFAFFFRKLLKTRAAPRRGLCVFLRCFLYWAARRAMLRARAAAGQF
jgi:hypothetical protein